MTRAEDSFRLPEGESEFLHRLRAILALMVVVSHVRSRLWGNYADEPDPSLLTKGVFFLTAFGPAAVIVFFVLSGYLITRLYLWRVAAGELSLGRFFAGRAVRLYLVLVPALAFSWGCFLWHGKGAADLKTLGLNLLFLQPKVAAPFAGNVPLWSLGFEGLAYFVSGLLALAVFLWRKDRNRVALVLGVLALTTALFVLSPWTMFYISLWGLGAGAAWGATRGGGKQKFRALFWLSSVAAVAAMAATRLGLPTPISEPFIGVPTAIALATMGASPIARLRESKWAQPLSGMSYSLYVTHFPLTLVIMLHAKKPANPIEGAAYFLATTTACLVFAWCFSRATERQTSRFRRTLGV